MAAKYTEAQVQAKIETEIPNIHFCSVEDLSDGCGAKFLIICVTDNFEGVPLLERHRMIHNAISEEMEHIHALELKTWTIAQYNKRMDKA